MRKQLLFFVIVVFGSNLAYAKWIKIAESSIIVMYADPGTIEKKADGTISMWTMIDLKSPMRMELGPYMSNSNRYDFDCQSGTARLRAIKYFSENLGRGQTIWESRGEQPHLKPEPVVGGSVLQPVLERACGKPMGVVAAPAPGSEATRAVVTGTGPGASDVLGVCGGKIMQALITGAGLRTLDRVEYFPEVVGEEVSSVYGKKKMTPTLLSVTRADGSISKLKFFLRKDAFGELECLFLSSAT